jgi:PKHD-type hydroxylase
MLMQIPAVLNEGELAEVRAQLAGQVWEDGAVSAGAAARRKHNLQLSGGAVQPLLAALGTRLMQHPAVKAWAEPKRIPRLMFSRYTQGMYYHSHNDAALTGTPPGRADVSFTLFLSPPASCSGGELVLETAVGEVPIKPLAGTLVLYETGLMHRVNTVSAGERLALVGWIESTVRSPQARDVLRDLGQAIWQAGQRDNDGEEVIRLRRVRANLLRMWAET